MVRIVSDITIRNTNIGSVTGRVRLVNHSNGVSKSGSYGETATDGDNDKTNKVVQATYIMQQVCKCNKGRENHQCGQIIVKHN